MAEKDDNIEIRKKDFSDATIDKIVGVLFSEYSSLKSEQSTRIAIRENAYLTNFLAIGVVLSLAFSKSPIDYTFFLLIPVISACIFWIYFNNDLMISKLQSFFQNEFPLKFLNTLNSSNENYNYELKDITDKIGSWEHYHRANDKFRGLRKFLNTLFLIIGFVGINVAAIILTSNLAFESKGLLLYLWIFDILLTSIAIISLVYTKDW